MILTAKTRYGVIAMVDLALRGNKAPVTIQKISESQQITVKYLEQIFNKLRKSNLLKSVKGPGGGYLLTKFSNEIYVSDIIKALDEPIKITRCSKVNVSCIDKKTRCATHDLWEGLTNQIYNYLQSISLQDICEKKIDINTKFSAYSEITRRNYG